jgi:hypothetical protein
MVIFTEFLAKIFSIIICILKKIKSEDYFNKTLL